MDKIYQCAAAFYNPLDTRYHIIIGRKGKTATLTIEFADKDFHHLMGLGKLKDLRIAKQSRARVFQAILQGDLSDEDLHKSRYFSQIKNRFAPLAAIEQFLDNNELIFRYNAKKNNFSLIEADYLLSTPHENKEVNIFLAQKEVDEIYDCRSFFPKEGRDYTRNQPKYTLLYKEKYRISTGKKIIQYNRFYKDEIQKE